MEAITGIILLLLVLLGAFSFLFLIIIQPIWGIVDVAISKDQSEGTKVAIILLTLLMLGPLMTIIYGLFITKSCALKRATLLGFAFILLSGVGITGLSIVHQASRERVESALHIETEESEASPEIEMPSSIEE